MIEKSLISLENEIWNALHAAVSDPQNPLRTVCLSTTGMDGFPESRIVVLRRAYHASKTIEIHTDSRSEKYRQLISNPNASLLFYDPKNQRQVRMRAAAMIDHQNPVSFQVLDTLSAHGKNLYGLDTDPGTKGKIDIQKSANYVEENSKKHFVVIRLKILSIDFLELNRAFHKRAILSYQDSSLVSASWMMP
ncbi:pyridoxamine 5'-phosphate oxidase family protein [Rhodonellum sp.]|uniref:pyridoxamine 5'-phosphate oxidase family protein n=1 Tax=Rhodonellum sp. TaxID=2231180 RepID=UPI00271821CA|nr:pyridoxamine 5'-phosphate oxidase family protein [Rhodonellum sp.]MDO9554066.1 pyridoxamine 5'-phosphate oxidase family protein [Rhodonellum sp.]